MTTPDPRGTVERTFLTGDNRTTAIITWTRGTGPASAVGEFTAGQLVTVRGGRVVPV